MTCKHDFIQTWRFEDGTPALWACVECRRRFEPLKDEAFARGLQFVHDALMNDPSIADQVNQENEI